MAITGSGRFVAIAANNNPFGFPSGVSGIVFGNGTTIYGRIVPRYTLSGSTVTGTALCFDPGASGGYLYMAFPNLSQLRINGSKGQSATIKVATGTTFNQSTYKETTNYTNYTFKCGLLTNVYSTS